MRKLFAVTLLHFRQTIKSKGLLFMMFGMPLLMTLIFGMLMGGASGEGGGSAHVYPVALVDQDQSFASRKLAEALEQEPTIRLIPATGAELAELYTDKQIDSAIRIPAGFEQAIIDGKSPDLELVTSPGGNRNFGISPALSREAAKVAGDLRLARKLAADPANEADLNAAFAKVTAERAKLAVAVTKEPARTVETKQDDKGAAMNQTTLGFSVMFVMMIVFMMGGVILQERQNGTWARLLTTPTPKASIISGYLLSFYAVGMFQFAVLVAATSLLFKIHWGPLPQLAVMTSAIVLCSGGMGLFIAGIVRTYEQQAAVSSIVVTATSMLGGVFWPLDFVGETMRRIGYLTPQAWAMDGLREIMLRGGSWDALLWPLVVLLALTTIFMSAGLLRVRYE